jgi:predicted aminopeptidase
VVLKIREFAAKELKLPVDKNYLKYVDLHRDYAVWNVNAAPALSLEPKRWWFPIVGKASYRGYFSEAAARKYGGKLKKDGWDVYIGGVATYSTLGWFRDPLFNTFIHEPDEELAEVLFHELAHQRVFIAGDTDFNEAFATAVAEEGVRRWLSKDEKAYQKYRREREREKQFVDLVLSTRDELKAVYDELNLNESARLERKQQIITGMRQKHELLKAQWGGKSEYDRWFANEINNAKLNTVVTYYTLVPAFHALLKANGGDLQKFYEAAERLGKEPKDKRHLTLEKLT